MRYTTFYTIKELDYKTIESRLLNEKISSELKNEILHLIADHKAMIECRKKIIEDQNFYASALFQLFAEPVVAAQSEENNPTDNDQSKLSHSQSDENNSPLDPKDKKRKNGGKKKLPLGNIINHTLSEENKMCPFCKEKMHKQRSKAKTYVLSLPMLSTETHISDSYRCLSCDVQETADNNSNIANECIGR